MICFNKSTFRRRNCDLPKNLEKGYKIGVTATSSGLDSETDHRRLESAIEYFNELAYPVVETNNCVKRKREEVQMVKQGQMNLWNYIKILMLPDNFGLWGNYLFEMLEYLDVDLIKNNPKWFQGYSDNTGLTFTITTNLDIATIYSNNFGSFGMKDKHRSLIDNIKILQGQDFTQYSFDKYEANYHERVTGLESYVLDEDVSWKNIYMEDPDNGISMEGRAIGGCLDVLLNLVGTRYDKTKEFISRYKEDGILWYLESYDLSSENLQLVCGNEGSWMV